MIEQAVILLGGQGTRLRALYPDRPKALVPVAGKPFLVHQLGWLFRAGIRAVHLAAGYRADDIESWLASAEITRARTITLSRELHPMGTGGALKFAGPYIQSDLFLAINGDTLAPCLDFQSLEKLSADFPIIGKTQERSLSPPEGRPIYMVVAPIEEAGRYGSVEFDEGGWVTAFREKAERRAGWVNAGIYLIRKEHLRLIPSTVPCSLEHDVFPQLVRDRRLRVFKTDPPLLDMGTPDGLRHMEEWMRAHSWSI